MRFDTVPALELFDTLKLGGKVIVETSSRQMFPETLLPLVMGLRVRIVIFFYKRAGSPISSLHDFDKTKVGVTAECNTDREEEIDLSVKSHFHRRRYQEKTSPKSAI